MKELITAKEAFEQTMSNIQKLDINVSSLNEDLKETLDEILSKIEEAIQKRQFRIEYKEYLHPTLVDYLKKKGYTVFSSCIKSGTFPLYKYTYFTSISWGSYGSCGVD